MSDTEDLRELLRQSGARGGKKSAGNLTKEQRKERARAAAQARWDKVKAEKPEADK